MSDDPIYTTIVDSIRDAFETMLMVDVSFIEHESIQELSGTGRVICTIGLGAEDLQSNLNLFFSRSSAKYVVGVMMGDEDIEDSMVEDGVGELANLIAGGIKLRLAEEDLVLNISLPTVISAENANISTASATTLYPFSFTIDNDYLVEGVFLIREVCDTARPDNLEMTAGD